ncbi:MAG: hypothetical protein HRU28_04415 [Rhizobiales bacterium]|nr:hypothetical protein [Hyphomicrobiales bacterium]
MSVNTSLKSAPRKPFPIRLNGKEKAYLKRKAGKLALGTYIRSQILDKNIKPRSRVKEKPSHDDVALARILACLGAHNISHNLSIIAKASDDGTLYVDDQIKSEIKQASEDIQVMRCVLMIALGLENPDGSSS